jgi:chromate transporter
MTDRASHENSAPSPSANGGAPGTWTEVLAAFARLGVTAFGGPVAHIGYFREAFVQRRRWLDDAAYADLVALCQMLPGPASSQVGFALGLQRAGLAGGLAAWTAFTLPSALLLVLFAYGVTAVDAAEAGWLSGLKLAAVAVVAHALWGMARSLCPDRPRATIAFIATGAALLVPGVWGQVGVILAGGLAGWTMIGGLTDSKAGHRPLSAQIGRPFAVTCLIVFALLLGGLPVATWLWPDGSLRLADSVYRTGALVFGGGHVVLPLLEAEMVDTGWVAESEFLAGYGAAQAVPGPLFTFAAFLGTVSGTGPGGVGGAAIALVAIFLPGMLLVIGLLPFWDGLRGKTAVRGAFAGVNAAVVGLLAAVLYTPVFTSAVVAPVDLVLVLAALCLLAIWRVPAWAVVLLAAAAGEVLVWI